MITGLHFRDPVCNRADDGRTFMAKRVRQKPIRSSQATNLIELAMADTTECNVNEYLPWTQFGQVEIRDSKRPGDFKKNGGFCGSVHLPLSNFAYAKRPIWVKAQTISPRRIIAIASVSGLQ